MNKTITTTSTSANTAVGQEIVLREGEKSRLVFKPMLVDNAKNPNACVKGDFVYQVKKATGKWEDYKTFNLNQMKDGEWIKLSLHSEELLTLISELDRYYGIFEKYGIPRGEREFILTDRTIRPILDQILKNRDNFKKILAEGGPEILEKLFTWISAAHDTSVVIEQLQKLNVDGLKKINSLIGITNLRKVIQIWNANKKNGDEAFWQSELENNAWVISQVFSHPVIIFQKKAYVGGKAIDNKSGNLVDFLFRNHITSNVVLIEIKTPLTKLMGTQYRSNVYSVSNELSGSINQVITYKDELYKNYFQLAGQSQKEFHSLNPQCLVICGCFENETLNDTSRRSFELFRNELKNVEIISFDELFSKIELLLKLVEG